MTSKSLGVPQTDKCHIYVEGHSYEGFLYVPLWVPLWVPMSPG